MKKAHYAPLNKDRWRVYSSFCWVDIELPTEAVITNKMASHCHTLKNSERIIKPANAAIAGSKLIMMLKPCAGILRSATISNV